MKLLYILNIAKRVNDFSHTSMLAAKELGYEFHIAGNWSYASDEERIADEQKYGIKIHQIDFVRAPYHPGNQKAYKQLKELVLKEKYDAIHCNTPIGGVLGRIVGKKCKVGKVIYQAHGFHFYKGAPALNWMIYYPIEKWLARHTDAIITINKEDFEFAKENLKLRGNGKTYYVPGVGIDLAKYSGIHISREKKRMELGIPNDAVVLISAGDLNSNKNNKIIISAMSELNKDEIYYILCGTGETKEDLKKQADAAGLSEKVIFLGYRNDINELYKAADCFVMPSLREGLSRAIMEAMASGLPCIVSRIRGNVDILDNEQGGYLVLPNDVHGFVDSIRSIADNYKTRKEMSEYNLDKIKSLDYSVISEKTKHVYIDVFEDDMDEK